MEVTEQHYRAAQGFMEIVPEPKAPEIVVTHTEETSAAAVEEPEEKPPKRKGSR